MKNSVRNWTMQVENFFCARNSLFWMAIASQASKTTFRRDFRLEKERERTLLHELDAEIVKNFPAYARTPSNAPFPEKNMMVTLRESELLFLYRTMVWCRDVYRLGESAHTYLGVAPEILDQAVKLTRPVLEGVEDVDVPVDPRKAE